MQISRFQSALPSAMVRPSTPSIGISQTPQMSVLPLRFEGSKKKADAPKLSWYLNPIARFVAYCYTHPRSMMKVHNRIVRKPGTDAPDSMDLKHLHLFHPLQPVAFKSADGLTLKGQWMPSPVPSSKTIVMGHGYFSDYREMLAVADPLRKAGYNSLLFDFRAHGQSEGEQTSVGFHEAKDIAGAVMFVTKTFPKESESLFYMGHSMGSSAMLYAPKSLKDYPEALNHLEKHITGIVLDCPYADLPEMARRFISNVDQLNPSNKLLTQVGKVLGGPLKYLANKLLDGYAEKGREFLNVDIDFQEMRPAKHFAPHSLVKKPILVIHGTKDSVTPYEQGKAVFETLQQKNPYVQMFTMPGEDHLSRDWDPGETGEKYTTALRGGDLYINRVLQFLEQNKQRLQQPAS